MIPVNEPVISSKAKKYILECLKTGWVSSGGEYISKFEKEFARFIGTKYAVTTTSGTSALHLAFAALGIKKGDEVIMPDLTIISCALAVIYLGAKPVFVDVESDTGNIEPLQIEAKITKRTKAVLVVHLFGHPANIGDIKKITNKHNLYLVEDAAQAHGAKYLLNNKWQAVGSVGDVSCFSFYGNKIVTSGEGGMLTTNNINIAKKARLLKDLAHSPKRRFLHEHLGYNYRMTNLQAALGVAQLENIQRYLLKKRLIANFYNKNLKQIGWLELPTEKPWAKSVFWMYAVKIKKGSKINKFSVMKKLKNEGIDTREFFLPLHKQPIISKLNIKSSGSFLNTVDLSKRGFYVPSGLALTTKQMQKVVSAFQKISHGQKSN